MKNYSMAVLAACLMMITSGMSQKVLTIGHRGAMGHEVENTIPSIKKALELGVDMMEIDVFKLKDDAIAVFHDKRLDKLSDAKGKIEDLSAGDLAAISLENGRKIPLLEEVLGTLDDKVRLNIELKGANTAEGVDRLVQEFMKKRGWTLDKFVISSFNWDELRDMRKTNQDIEIAILTSKDPLGALEVAKELKAVAINPNYKRVTASNVERIKKEGFKVFTWTVNEPKDIDRMKAYGVDGIFSDFPERVNP